MDNAAQNAPADPSLTAFLSGLDVIYASFAARMAEIDAEWEASKALWAV